MGIDSLLPVTGFAEDAEGEHGFGWHINDDEPRIAFSTAADASVLNIKFTGNSDAGQMMLWQVAPVGIARRYRFSFDAQTADIVSGGLPIGVVADAATGDSIAETEPLIVRPGEWKTFQIDISLSPQTEAVKIGIRRWACAAGPCPIFGELRLRNFALREIE
jgi:hypothetical protein